MSIKKILIVDDQEMIRKLVKMTLAAEDFEVLEAKNGVEALAIAQKKIPDVIILDVMMPGELNGIDVCKQLRRIPVTKEATILMLSAKTQTVDKEEGIYAGATDYLVKPFSPAHLLGKIREHLG
ncbi:response regulator transcription factor [Thiomicrorhabdus lithotrophica]|uniref:Response regulator n=1 Tax=Thiomicrorhabdus lithotrophica TaxID=2949997 RepID=A0ABY8CCI3_9GAMM|nr:response regulator [Thiomicrorhabdus lithotrophica]WEJ61833.1 response regulator [Thiomicrorhabdus lithotrophica]